MIQDLYKEKVLGVEWEQEHNESGRYTLTNGKN